MNSFSFDSFKYKLIPLEELVIWLDRLSRFKLPDYSFNRVFKSVFNKYLISPKYSIQEIEHLETDYIAKTVQFIWNKSVEALFSNVQINYSANFALKMVIYSTFKNIDSNTKTLIDTDLFISPILEKLDYNSSVFNLQFLIKVNEHFQDNDTFTIDELIKLRQKYKLVYPVEKLLIVEGVTEEILLPVFADRLNCNFKSKGVYIYGAGGKSKSPALYYKIKDNFKKPIIMLFDNDAKEICNILNNQILSKDKCILISNGEFEDILPHNLISQTLNNEYEPASPFCEDDFKYSGRMTDNIENFYRTRHLGEYKKSKVAKFLAQNIISQADVSYEIKALLNDLI